MGADHAVESSRVDPVDAIITLCPGGEERVRRMMSVIRSGRMDLIPLLTHRFELDHIEKAYGLSVHQRDGVLKVAITPRSSVARGCGLRIGLTATCVS